MKKTILFSTLLIWILSGCYSTNVTSNSAIQKRKYTKGFFIAKAERHKSLNESQLENEDQHFNSENSFSSVDNDFEYVVSNELAVKSDDNTIFDLGIKSTNIPLLESPTELKSQSYNPIEKEENCDLMVFKNGDEKEVKILEIGKTDIRYRKCNDPEGTIFTVSNSQVLMIKHSDGTKTVISELQNGGDSADNPFDTSTGKNQLVAAILAFFLGILGIHRFYLGHIGMGILYLLTAGLCGIGALIDFILILTGDLKPKNGEYGKTI